jgi:hypothetical protein
MELLHPPAQPVHRGRTTPGHICSVADLEAPASGEWMGVVPHSVGMTSQHWKDAGTPAQESSGMSTSLVLEVETRHGCSGN